MATLKDTFTTITGWAKDIVDLGLALALVFLVVDILFGVTTGIVANIADLIASFVDEGIVGLIAFIVFLAIYRK
ncbi:MAG: hypothetical protein H8E82_03325 [Candidatus Marinimicrobia bacterium]|nr:hypothetical protein [Candidatus Neomarinimicrobiota bacterium]MBL7046026.1 hypothetical protein [Candidatus Neomarinimicrobiota bacterium]